MLRIGRSLLLVALVVAASNASAAAIKLPQSGQSSCYNATGASVPCAGTGQDGDKKTGVEWPSPRFTDNGNGTMTDSLTGLIWLKDATCNDTVGGVEKTNGYLSWNEALAWSNGMGDGSCGLIDGSKPGDWRLPSRKEMKSLVNRQLVVNALGLVSSGFQNVQANSYWTSSTNAGTPANAWYICMNNGHIYNLPKSEVSYVLPVRDPK